MSKKTLIAFYKGPAGAYRTLGKYNIPIMRNAAAIRNMYLPKETTIAADRDTWMEWLGDRNVKPVRLHVKCEC